MKPTGWIIYNGNLQSEKFRDFANMLHIAAALKDCQTQIYKNNELLALIGFKEQQLLPKRNLPDFVLFTDKDIYLAKQLELLGIRVFNRAKAIELSDDKIASYQALAVNNLPIPKTIVAPKAYVKNQDTDFYQLDQIIASLGLPMIVKEAFGSFGEQVYLIQTKEQLEEKVNTLQGKPFMFQQFIASSYGEDLRLHVVGDQVVAAMKRKAKNDFRANITAGGTMEHYIPTSKEAEIAIAATKAIGADFAGVDLLIGENKEPIICEINSNAHIRNMLDCTGVNVADYIVDYVMQKLRSKDECKQDG